MHQLEIILRRKVELRHSQLFSTIRRPKALYRDDTKATLGKTKAEPPAAGDHSIPPLWLAGILCRQWGIILHEAGTLNPTQPATCEFSA